MQMTNVVRESSSDKGKKPEFPGDFDPKSFIRAERKKMMQEN